MRTFVRGKVTLLFMMLGMLIAVPTVAYAADSILADGDVLTAGDNLSRNLGTLAPGATFTANPPTTPASDVSFTLDCAGNNHFNAGETADLNVSATSKKDAAGNTITGGSVSATGLSNFSGPTTVGTTTYPNDGSNDCPATNAPIGTSQVTIVAPKKAGTYTYTVTYHLNRDTGTGTNELALAQGGGGPAADDVTVSFTFTVPNVAPVINSFQVSGTDNGTSATEGQTKTYTISASDANEDTLTYGLVKDSGTANVTINAVTGSPGSFTVQFDTPGSLVLKASASDGTVTTTQNKNVTVASANTAPVAVGNSYNTNEDTTLNVPAPGVLGNDTDAQNNTLTATLVTGPSHAAATGGFTLNANGSFSYTPVANFHGTDTFTYKANDSALDSNVATVTITVASVNDVPTCQNVAIETDEDQQGSVTADCSDPDDNDTLTYEIVDQPTDGAASVGVLSGVLEYNPDLNFNGSDSFTYKANDGSAFSNVSTVDVTVNPVNDPPPTPGAISTTSELSSDGTFTLNWDDSIDVDGDNVTYTLEKRDANDANWSPVDSGLTSPSYTFGSGNALAEGTWDFRVKAVDSPAGAESDFSTAENLVKVDKSGPNAPTLSFATTGQSFKATVSGVDWYKDSAKIDVAANGDPALADTSDGSGVDAASLLPNPFSVTQNGTSTASKKIKDNATNESAAGTLQVHVDAANPTLDPCPTTAPFILGSGGGTQTVTITASDGESGVDNAASTLSGTVSTSTVGEKTFTFTAKDNVGHSSAPKQCTYNVNYNWSGFFSPVDNNGTYNTVKAGSAIPAKFSLAGNQGLSILAAGFPTSQKVTCNAGAPQDTIEETVTAGNSSLSYDSSLNQYNYVWKTDKAWGGTCRVFSMKLIDGTTHTALFNFTK